MRAICAVGVPPVWESYDTRLDTDVVMQREEAGWGAIQHMAALYKKPLYDIEQYVVVMMAVVADAM